MSLPALYQALSDPTRLRILNLLAVSPLCVQHLQSGLQMGQVMVSKHLLILRTSGFVEARKVRNWRLYGLPAKPASVIGKNLECLLACIRDEQLFQDDLRRLQPLRPQIQQFLKQPVRTSPRLKAPRSVRRRSVEERVASPTPVISDTLEDHLL